MIATAIFFQLLVVLVTSNNNPLKEVDNDVVMLKNVTYIYCIGENSVNSPTFISPPLPEIRDSIDLIESSKFWKNDEWEIKNSTASLLGAVLDRRWNDFVLRNGSYLHFSRPTSVSFSIYGSETLTISMDNDYYLDYVNLKTGNKNEWNHFVIFVKDGHIYLEQNGKYIHTTRNMVPVQVIITSNNTMYYKIHEYNYKEATEPNKNPTFLKIPPMGKSLLIIYTSMCRSCALEVVVNNEPFTNLTSISEKSAHTRNLWQIQEIPIDPDGESLIQLNRLKHGRDDEAFWALDIRMYNNHLNTVRYHVNSTNDTQHTCSYLNERRKRNRIEKRKHCEPGLLGRNCDIPCEKALGKSYPNCEEHVICNCYKSMLKYCFCAWGFTGSYCNKTCENGSWGADCNETCPSDCSSCDVVTGECSNPSKALSGPEIFIFVLAVVFVVVTLVVAVCLRLLQRSQSGTLRTPYTKSLLGGSDTL